MQEVKNAIALLQKGEVIALPTETVYGLAADATNNNTVAKIYTLKTRPAFNPLIIHVANLEVAQTIGAFSANALAAAKKYWPGALTIVVPKLNNNFAQLASAGLSTIAIRVPSHPIMQQVLQSGLMLAAPSANISGNLSPTTAAHVKKSFPNIYIVDGGACEVGLESTIITFDENDELIVLREGVIQFATRNTQPVTKIIAPGMLLKHYSPKSPIRINAANVGMDEVLIGFGNMPCDYNLSKSANLTEAAANLFSMLHEADEKNLKIAVAPIPNIDIGVAINDKLIRAASGK